MKCGREYQLTSSYFLDNFNCESGGNLTRQYTTGKRPKTRKKESEDLIIPTTQKIESKDLIIAILVTWNVCLILSFLLGFLVYLFGIAATIFLFSYTYR